MFFRLERNVQFLEAIRMLWSWENNKCTYYTAIVIVLIDLHMRVQQNTIHLIDSSFIHLITKKWLDQIDCMRRCLFTNERFMRKLWQLHDLRNLLMSKAYIVASEKPDQQTADEPNVLLGLTLFLPLKKIYFNFQQMNAIYYAIAPTRRQIA